MILYFVQDGDLVLGSFKDSRTGLIEVIWTVWLVHKVMLKKRILKG